MSRGEDFHVLQGRTAGFVTRMLAYVIDIAIVAGIVSLGGWIAVLVDNMMVNLAVDVQVSLTTIYIGIAPFIAGVYFVMFWALTGRTIGKWLMGLKVVDATGHPPTLGRAVIRLLGYSLSAVAFWVGYLWVIIDKDRQGWHDHLAKTWVVYDYERRKGGEVYEAVIHRHDRENSAP